MFFYILIILQLTTHSYKTDMNVREERYILYMFMSMSRLTFNNYPYTHLREYYNHTFDKLILVDFLREVSDRLRLSITL